MVDQITGTITLYTWPFFCYPWEEEIWYQYLGKWNRILKDWDPVKGNFIRNGFPQKSNSAFIVRSLQLYDKHLYARLRLYFNDTLIKKKGQKGTWVLRDVWWVPNYQRDVHLMIRPKWPCEVISCQNSIMISILRSVNTGFYGQYLFFQHQISEHPFVQSINCWRALHWKQVTLELIHSMGWDIAMLTSAFAPHLCAWWLTFFPMMCDGLIKQSRWCMIK